MSQQVPTTYLPTDGLSYDPSEPLYWDKNALEKEIHRVFEVCHGCRMCFKYCDSFPSLFSFIDERHDGHVKALTADETSEVMDQCFQCKLCEVQCPYTPRDGHEFQLDFPKLVHRWTAQRARNGGRDVRDLVLGNPDLAGALARKSFGLANKLNRNRLHRWFMEKVLGIHREKLLPDFASTTFERWAESQGKIRSKPQGEAVLFPTCFIQNNEPQVGRDTLEVMERNEVSCDCAGGFACCGMPAWEAGDLETLRKNAKRNIEILQPWVQAGAKVLVINPTCAMMMRREYPELVAPEDREDALKLAEAVRDPGEYLWSLRNEDRFNTDFRSSPGEKVAYHAPCHLRAQAVGFRGRDLMRKIPGVKPVMVMECCGHDGTYAMKVEHYEASIRVGEKAFDGMTKAGAEIWATECPLAAIQFAQHAGRRPMHPMTILARAYRRDGFADEVEGANSGDES